MDEQGRVQGVSELTDEKKKKTSGSGGGGGGKKKGILIAVLIGFIIFMWVSAGGVNVVTVKDIFSGSANENLESMFRGMKDVERMNKTQGQKLDEVYDKNNIYEDRVAYHQPDKAYILYVYTGNETVDGEFNNWVQENQKKYKVYKLDRAKLTTQEEMMVYASDTLSPLLYVFKEVDRGEKVLEDVIDSEDELPEVGKIMDRLVNKKKGE